MYFPHFLQPIELSENTFLDTFFISLLDSKKGRSELRDVFMINPNYDILCLLPCKQAFHFLNPVWSPG